MSKPTFADQIKRKREKAEADAEYAAMAMAFSDFIGGNFNGSEPGFSAFYDTYRNTYIQKARTFQRVLENTKRVVIG